MTETTPTRRLCMQGTCLLFLFMIAFYVDYEARTPVTLCEETCQWQTTLNDASEDAALEVAATNTDDRRYRLDAPVRRIPRFMARLAAIPRDEPNRIWGTCMAEKSRLKTYEYEYEPNKFTRYTVPTVKNVLTAYRKAVIEELGADHPALEILTLSLKDQEEFRQAGLIQTYDDHTNLRPIDPDKLVGIATELIKIPDDVHVMTLAAALLMLTGRRFIEIIKLGVFSGATRRRSLVFAGQAKTRNAETAQTEPYVIPVLANPTLILKAIDVLRRRTNVADLDNQKVNGRYSKHLGTHAAQLFHDANRMALIPKELRAAYATTAFAWYCPNGTSMNAYFAAILGHSFLDVVTSVSYIDFYPLAQKRAFVTDHKRALSDAIAAQEIALEAEPDPAKRPFIEERIEMLESLL